MGKYLKFTVLSAAALLMSGCIMSGAGKAADQYYTALEGGDADTAVEYYSEEAEDELENFRKITGGIRQMFADYELGTETEEELRTLLKTIVSRSYSSHKITSEERVSDTEYKILAEVEMITEESSASCLNALDYDSFYNEIADELTEINRNEGEEAANRFMIIQMIHYLNLSAEDAFAGAEYETGTYKLTMILEGEDWKIADIERE